MGPVPPFRSYPLSRHRPSLSVSELRRVSAPAQTSPVSTHFERSGPAPDRPRTRTETPSVGYLLLTLARCYRLRRTGSTYRPSRRSQGRREGARRGLTTPCWRSRRRCCCRSARTRCRPRRARCCWSSGGIGVLGSCGRSGRGVTLRPEVLSARPRDLVGRVGRAGR